MAWKEPGSKAGTSYKKRWEQWHGQSHIQTVVANPRPVEWELFAWNSPLKWSMFPFAFHVVNDRKGEEEEIRGSTQTFLSQKGGAGWGGRKKKRGRPGFAYALMGQNRTCSMEREFVSFLHHILSKSGLITGSIVFYKMTVSVFLHMTRRPRRCKTQALFFFTYLNILCSMYSLVSN